MLNNEANVEFIGFKAVGEWNVAELQTFVGSISKIYEVFLSLNLKDKIVDRQLASYEEHLFILDKYMHHPESEEFLMHWRELFHLYRKHKIPYLPSLPFFHPFQPEPKGTFQIVTATEIYQNLEQYSNKEEWLKIYRIRIGSPGYFSFEGLGEVIKEFRELVKDIWFKNKQEKTLGQLEIIDKYLTMRRKHNESNYPPLPQVSSEKELVKVLNEQVNKIKELESKGKLTDVAENIDYLPE